MHDNIEPKNLYVAGYEPSSGLTLMQVQLIQYELHVRREHYLERADSVLYKEWCLERAEELAKILSFLDDLIESDS